MVVVAPDDDALRDERLTAGSDAESVADVPVREKIGNHEPLLRELLVRVQELELPLDDDDHCRDGGQCSTPGGSGAAEAALPCGTQFGGGLVIV